MHTILKTLGVGAASVALVAGSTGAANADSTLIKIGKYGQLSAHHKVAFIKLKLTCSPDTTDAEVSLSLSQVTSGSAQTAYSTVSFYNAVECTSREEAVWIPVRRNAGDFNWIPGKARVGHVELTTTDPQGDHYSDLHGRTVTLRR
jgi:hypothetical protein